MLQLEVYGDLVPWTAARRKGRIYYDPKDVEKKRIKWQIATQYKGPLHAGPTILDFMFYFPIPKATSKIRRRQMLSGVIVPIVAPDCSNLIKCYEDCLKGIVIEDDRITCDISAKCRYAEQASVLIRVFTFQERYGNGVQL